MSRLGDHLASQWPAASGPPSEAALKPAAETDPAADGRVFPCH